MPRSMFDGRVDRLTAGVVSKLGRMADSEAKRMPARKRTPVEQLQRYQDGDELHRVESGQVDAKQMAAYIKSMGELAASERHRRLLMEPD